MSSLREALTELAEKWRVDKGCIDEKVPLMSTLSIAAAGARAQCADELTELLSLPDERERLETALMDIRHRAVAFKNSPTMNGPDAPTLIEEMGIAASRAVRNLPVVLAPKQQERCAECGGRRVVQDERCRGSAIIGHIKGQCTCGPCPSCTGERA